MGFNPWLVALLAAGPLLILVVGLAAAAEGLGSQTVWILIGAIAVAGGVAAYKAIDTARAT
jgi:hypothetical protein